MDFIDAEGFRANVGIILIDGAARVLIAGRRGRGGWQFPQGGIRPEEQAEAAMFRELHEEVGLDRSDVAIVGATEGWLRYRLPDRFIRREQTPLCIGQKQRWFLLQLSCGAERVRFDCSAQPEFDRCRWVDYWRPVKEVVYFKRPVYVRALKELAPLAFPDAEPPPPPSWWPRRWLGALNDG
jgi:putative (di)nucleoside polyphosphate hydrolase